MVSGATPEVARVIFDHFASVLLCFGPGSFIQRADLPHEFSDGSCIGPIVFPMLFSEGQDFVQRHPTQIHTNRREVGGYNVASRWH